MPVLFIFVWHYNYYLNRVRVFYFYKRLFSLQIYQWQILAGKTFKNMQYVMCVAINLHNHIYSYFEKCFTCLRLIGRSSTDALHAYIFVNV